MSNDEKYFSKLELKPSEVDMIIYHKNCPDGFGAAFSGWKYNKLNKNKDITFIEASYDDKPPDVKGKNVLICDFSYKKQILLKLIEDANKLAVLDHHKSAMEDLNVIDDKYKVFDMTHSGANITWRYFFPDQEIPLLIQYIEDRDIWLKKMYMTDEFSSWLSTISQEFNNYNTLLNNDYLMTMINTEGLGMGKLIKKNIQRESNHAIAKFMLIDNNYYMIAYVNTTGNKSDVGNRTISDLYPNADFSVSYSIEDRTNSTLFSLRSTHEHADVSHLASRLGGGGHRNASGVKIGYITSTLPGEVLDNGKIYDKINKLYFDTIDINKHSYNAVYLNLSSLKSKVGKYLLRNRYYNKNKDGSNDYIQVCRCIEKNVLEFKEVNNDRVQIASIWSYNGNENTTTFSTVLDNRLSDKDKNQIIDDLSSVMKVEQYGDTLVSTLYGLHNRLV